MDDITTIGLDIAKNVFQLHGVDAQGQVVLRKALRRANMIAFFTKLPPCLIGMEACSTAHHWARTLMELGHEVRLISPAYVKPFVKRHKNDAADAAAICEAVVRPSMRFVSVKSEEQQATLMLHSARELLISQRTALMNALRGHFAELGIVVAQGARNVGDLLLILERMGQGSNEKALPETMWLVLQPLANALIGIEAEIAKLDKEILAIHRKDAVSLRLASIPGIGPVTASFLSASIPDPGLFEGGREFAAFLGLVPRQYSSGGKPRLGRISKMGNRHLRKLLVVGAHAALYSIKNGKTKSPLADWARALLANKMARIAWAIMTRAGHYQPNLATQ